MLHDEFGEKLKIMIVATLGYIGVLLSRTEAWYWKYIIGPILAYISVWIIRQAFKLIKSFVGNGDQHLPNSKR